MTVRVLLTWSDQQYYLQLDLSRNMVDKWLALLSYSKEVLGSTQRQTED